MERALGQLAAAAGAAGELGRATAGRFTSSQCQKPLWVGASGSKQVTTKPLVSSGKPDQRRCGEWSLSPPAIGATKLLSISSPSVTSSLSSVNDGLGGSRSYGSGRLRAFQ